MAMIFGGREGLIIRTRGDNVVSSDLIPCKGICKGSWRFFQYPPVPVGVTTGQYGAQEPLWDSSNVRQCVLVGQ